MAIQIWQPGDKIKNDRFHILKQLGKGGFGITYLAEDTVKKQQIVIKTLNANQQGEADFAQKQENFVKEGFTLKTFNHPHIVKVYEPIQIGELWGLVMEYIPGQDLDDYIKENGRLGEAEALNYIDQIAQALDCVHQQKFFHRDVKPHNIMLRQDRGEAVLIDFGIAKEFVDLETIYLSNSLGTELYKPIEQYEKRGQFGAYTDIYALAVTLYHLLTGAAPGGGSPLYTAKARKDAQDKGWGDKLDEYLWGELAKAGVSERTQAAIKAGMEIDPSKRPQTMPEFRKMLRFVTTSQTTIVNLVHNISTFDININLLIYRHQKTIFNRSLVMTEVREFLGLEKKKTNLKPAIKFQLERDNNWSEKGNKPLQSGKLERVGSSYNRTLKFEQNNDNILFNRQIALNILCQVDESIDSDNLELESNPDFWCKRGNMLNELGRYEEAMSSYDCALKIKPDNYFSWCKRGNILDRLGRYEEAISSYDCALKINPNYDFAWYLRGNVLGKTGKYKEAVSSYDRSIEIKPGNTEACRERQIVMAKLVKSSITR